MSPARLWRLSAALRRKRLMRLAFLVKKINSAIYHNSLPPGVDFSPDIWFGHHGFGTIIHGNVTIGREVRIWQNVLITVHAASGASERVTIEDGVHIGAHTVIIAPRGRSVTIGRGARIGAGALINGDIPPGATVVSEPSRIIPARETRVSVTADEAGAADLRPEA
jgi:serine O-acetyltransferase